MSLDREIAVLHKLLREVRKIDPGIKRHRTEPGTARAWVLKYVPVKPTKTADFLRKAQAAGFLKATVYQALIRLIDEGHIAENRFRREIWRP